MSSNGELVRSIGCKARPRFKLSALRTVSGSTKGKIDIQQDHPGRDIHPVAEVVAGGFVHLDRDIFGSHLCSPLRLLD